MYIKYTLLYSDGQLPSNKGAWIIVNASLFQPAGDLFSVPLSVCEHSGYFTDGLLYSLCNYT